MSSRRKVPRVSVICSPSKWFTFSNMIKVGTIARFVVFMIDKEADM